MSDEIKNEISELESNIQYLTDELSNISSQIASYGAKGDDVMKEYYEYEYRNLNSRLRGMEGRLKNLLSKI